MRLYRTVVDEWPKDFEGGWPRFIEYDKAPVWLQVLMEYEVTPERLRYIRGDWSEGIAGIVMPRTDKRHWLSRVAAETWIHDACALGARAHLEISEPIEWEASA